MDNAKLIAQSSLWSTPFPIRCCVLEKWDTILLSPGRNKFSGIQKPIISAKLNRIDGKPMEFEWKIFPGLKTAGILNEILKMMGELQCDPADFKGIFMSIFNDIEWDAKGNEKICGNNSKRVREYARRFPRGHWSFVGPGSEKKWYATYNSKPNGCWDRTAEEMMQNFQRSGHLVFRETSALERGELRSKGSRMKSIHFNGSTLNIELLLQMFISVIQLSLYGALADLTKELPDDQRAPRKHVALDQMEQEIITLPLFAEVRADDERQ